MRQDRLLRGPMESLANEDDEKKASIEAVWNILANGLGSKMEIPVW